MYNTNVGLIFDVWCSTNAVQMNMISFFLFFGWISYGIGFWLHKTLQNIWVKVVILYELVITGTLIKEVISPY